jgi:hypothetical protein
MVRGVSSGTTTIVAVCGYVAARATLTVVPAPPVG